MANIKLCKSCRSKMDTPLCGYRPDNKNICSRCKVPLVEIDMSEEDFWAIRHTSEDVNLLEAMIKLKQENILEYGSRMVEFRKNDLIYREQHKRKPVEEPKLKCPNCGSTAITTGARGVSGFWGFIGAGKTVNRCGNCGHKWTPRG